MSTCKKTQLDTVPQLLMNYVPPSSDQIALVRSFGVYKAVVNEKSALNSIGNNNDALEFEKNFLTEKICLTTHVGVVAGKLKIPAGLKLGPLTLKTQPL